MVDNIRFGGTTIYSLFQSNNLTSGFAPKEGEGIKILKHFLGGSGEGGADQGSLCSPIASPKKHAPENGISQMLYVATATRLGSHGR